jgi:hypothetical protein
MGIYLARGGINELFFQWWRKKPLDQPGAAKATSKTGKLANFEGVKSTVPAGDLMGFNSEAMRGGSNHKARKNFRLWTNARVGAARQGRLVKVARSRA